MPEKQGRQLPTRAIMRPDGLYLALRDIPAAELRDAFMQETVARVAAAESFVHIERQHLGKVGSDSAPTGIVFHVARCGSTLIAQLLKQHPDCVVYAEPLPINELLLPPYTCPRHELVAALRSLGAAFAQHAGQPYVLKLSSWNTLFCDVVAEAFPDSPWILSLRDPVEVGVSLLAQTPGWMQGTAGAATVLRAQVDPTDASSTPAEFVARLYGAFCEAACRLDVNRGKLVRYEALPAAVWETVAPHFSLRVDEDIRSRMTQAARVNAKAPVGQAEQYSSDTRQKQDAAPAALRQAIETLAAPSLRRLEQLHALRS